MGNYIYFTGSKKLINIAHNLTDCCYRYVRKTDGGEVTEDYLVSGKYEIEVMGKRYPATLYLKSPFDPSNKRQSGCYDT